MNEHVEALDLRVCYKCKAANEDILRFDHTGEVKCVRCYRDDRSRKKQARQRDGGEL